MTAISSLASTRHRPRLRLKLLALSLILWSCAGLTMAASPGTEDGKMQGAIHTEYERSAPFCTPQAFKGHDTTTVAITTANMTTSFDFHNSEARNINFSKGGWLTRFIGLARLTLPTEQRGMLPAHTGRDEPVRIRLFISGF